MTETSAKILCDSISPVGHRFTTFEVVYPRPILAEVNTHRQLSRGSASSRAVPVEKMIRRVLEDPYVPTHWGKNQKGMQAELEFDDADDLSFFDEIWRSARNEMVRHVKMLSDRGLHKQIANRLIEAFMWHPTVISATEWSNFFHLRDHKDAHPDFRDLAHAMRELYQKSEPRPIGYDDWHTPYAAGHEWVQTAWEYDDSFFECGFCGEKTHRRQGLPQPFEGKPCNYPADLRCKVSVGRCARVSTLTHEGKRSTTEDIVLHDKMGGAGHMSPYENVARPMTPDELELFKRKKMRWDPEHKCWYWVGARYETPWHEPCPHWQDYARPSEAHEGEYTHFLGNVQGWVQLRKMIPFEEDILGARP